MSKNKITLTLAIISGMLAVTAITAQASNNVAFAVAERTGSGMLTQVGTPTGVLSPLKGFAKDLPLVSVMRQITPNGWKVKKVKTGETVLDNDMLVSWEGGSSWVETLNGIVKSNPVNATVYWQEKEIVLSPVVVAPVKKNSVFELAGVPGTEKTDVTDGGSQASEEQVVSTGTVTITEAGASTSSANTTEVTANTTTIVAEAAPVTPVTPSKTWDLATNKSLMENVNAWGHTAGYRVVWLAEDYPVDDFRVLSGEFDSPDGPIKQLADDYGPKSMVEKPLTFEFLQNATLVVKNFKFEQSGFPQWNK